MAMTFRSAASTAAQGFLLSCSVILFGALLVNHYQMITFPLPLDYNEAGMLSITATIAEGINPYAFESQPVRAAVYPVLYNILIAPLSAVLGNTLPLHRAVAGIFLLLTCGVCYLVVRRQGNTRLESFAAATLWYAGLLYYSTPIGSPNSLGLFLFFASISIPWLYQFSGRSLGLALVLGLLAFYSKQYQIACLGFIALYLFISISKKKGLLFGVASLVLCLLTLRLVLATSPFFLDNTVFTQFYVAAPYSSYGNALTQLVEFAQIYSPLLAIVMLHATLAAVDKHALTASVAGEATVRDKAGSINLVDLNAPLLTAGVNYFWLCFACAVLVIVLVLGKNAANHLSYLFQLMTPFLLIGCFKIIAQSGRIKPVYYLLVIAAFYQSYSMLSHDFSTKPRNWEKVRQIMSSADTIYASTIVLAEVVKSGKDVYDNGHTRYFPHAEQRPALFAHGGPARDITRIWDQHVKRIQAMIAVQEFDLILLDQWMLLPEPSPRSTLDFDMQAELQKYYQLSDSIVLLLAKRPGGGAYTIRVWTPKRTGADGQAQGQE